MLVLSRTANESVIIENNIKVTILGIRGKQVRVGIDAPKYIQVHREEIYQKIQNEKLSDKEANNEHTKYLDS